MPGVCGLVTVVQARMVGEDEAELSTATDCELVQSAVEALGTVDVIEAVSTDCVYAACRTAGMHPACPVPCAIVKAVEVAAGLALPRSVSIDVTP